MNSGIEALILAEGLRSPSQRSSAVIPPFCLRQIGGRSVLDYWVKSLAEAGVSTAQVISHTHAEWMRKYISANNIAVQLRLVESHVPKIPDLANTVNRAPADDADDNSDSSMAAVSLTSTCAP